MFILLRLCKIYYDGSHYVAMPIIHPDDSLKSDIVYGENVEISDVENLYAAKKVPFDEIPFDVTVDPSYSKGKELVDLFEDNYSFAMSLGKKERLSFFRNLFSPYFSDQQLLNSFIQDNLNRKFKNFIYRRLRCLRKLNLTEFNYFCTFTYDSKKMSEDDFRKSFSYFLQNKSSRDGWRYIGVWERGSENDRLHFHCLLNCDDSTLPGENVKKRKWSSKVRRMVSVVENSYLATRFGANDFSPLNLEDADEYLDILNYLIKYIEKSGERLVYSRGLSQYFESYIDDEDDVVCIDYIHGVKMVLFDDFANYNSKGEFIGVMSKDLSKRLKTRNS